MNKQDRQVVRYPKERMDGIDAVSKRMEKKAASLSEIEGVQHNLCIVTLKAIAPGPRVSRLIGEFLIDLADEQDRQDKKFGTDSNNENQLVFNPDK